MAKVFIDDSGSSKEEPLMWVAGWVGEVSTWEKFSTEWDQTLNANNPKPIRYFKHSEARSRTKCFTSFSETEADEKTVLLAETIANEHPIYGVAYYVFRPFLNAMIEKYSVKQVHQYLKDPFYICLNSLVGYVIGSQFRNYPDDKVDFVFDGKPGSAQANRVMAQWETLKEFGLGPETLRKNMGTILPMNDQEVLPLQAADLLASQLRLAWMEKGVKDPEPLYTLRRKNVPLWVSLVDEISIRSTISFHNFGVSTRRLSTVKRERDRAEKLKGSE
ncbi:MAG TPA: DUF3800 domain-containing protein [Pyrinomonadaceae bacterium]|nr:DUF3800 domain-containing protein [Pyrinomonadaceae bacterium]